MKTTGHNASRHSSWIATLTMAALMTGAAYGQTTAKMERTHSLASSARTSVQHATVSKQYRQHAESFAAQAAEHEKNVRDLTRASGAAPIKWPGLASGQLQKEKEKALEARRAERETKELADRHLRLAVEAQAEPTDAAGN